MEIPNSKRRAIVVMGVSGCGKSTVGRVLAEEIAAPFLEGDHFHSAANIAKMSAGIALRDEDRWDWLAAFGRAMGAEARQNEFVVGACSALRKRYREVLTDAAGMPLLFVCLQADKASLERRLGKREHFMPASLLESQLETLEVPSPEENAMCLDADLPIANLVALIRVALRSHR